MFSVAWFGLGCRDQTLAYENYGVSERFSKGGNPKP